MRVRAIEGDTAILICDASQRGISGLVDSTGQVRFLQTGVQASFEIEVPFIDGAARGWYGRLGDSGSLAVLLAFLAFATILGRALEQGEELVDVVRELKRRFTNRGQQPLLVDVSPPQDRAQPRANYLTAANTERDLI
jgi:hypothetical protein